ncbi:outer membrane protein transport protein [Fusobacterium necrophorum]|uniref:OmpP1/FadL family transporter n=1 Tax=Fusobacterium necrophorum TaxID=859 RepID=UPI000788820C|nr:outer membrane protein transport protein [Fusobacterium necrophorum]KYM44064.1 hypothetical protein A2U15_07595 [Fusobacterium necrophorum subsp. funduliforme]MDK4522103.1 outer membrane protein transport protein [Fusobacterium necrophorum]
MNLKLKCALLAGVLSMTAYGASIDHIQTYAPEYLGNQAQNGMINNVSGYYNPAGLSRLEEGKYVNVGLQYAAGHEKMSYNGKEHKAKLRQPVPNISFYSVDKNGANYITFGAIAGGGKLKYNGVSGVDVATETLKLQSLPISVYDKNSVVTGKNMYEHLTFGRAFNVDEKLSFSIAGRIIHGTRELKGNLNLGISAPSYFSRSNKNTIAKLENALMGDIKSKREAWGYGFQLGVNYKVNEKWNVAARYDSRVKLNFKAKGEEHLLQTQGIIGKNIGFTSFYPQYTPGTKIRRDLPAILALGASYQATDNWLVSAAGNFYFNRQAKMDRISGKTANYKNGWEIALGNEYKLNEKFTVIGSINYANTGAPRSSYNDTEYALNSTTLGAGLRYQYDDTLAVTASVAHFMYEREQGIFKETHKVSENQKYHKNITAFGLGFTKKF